MLRFAPYSGVKCNLVRNPARRSARRGYPPHADLSWGEKGLRAGQFCKKGANREYHRYGYHCQRNGHLRRY